MKTTEAAKQHVPLPSGLPQSCIRTPAGLQAEALLFDVSPNFVHFIVTCEQADKARIHAGQVLNLFVYRGPESNVELGTVEVLGIESENGTYREYFSSSMMALNLPLIRQIMPKATVFAQLGLGRPPRVKSELRRSERIDIRAGEGFSAKLLYADRWEDVQLFDISCFGASILLPAPTNKIELSHHSKVVLGISLPGHQLYKIVAEVRSISTGPKDTKKVGFTFVFEPLEKEYSDRPKLTCSQGKTIQGVIYKEHFYYERAPVEIQSINSEAVTILIPETDLILFPTMPVEFSLLIHAALSPAIKGIVRKVVIHESKQLIVHIDLVELPKRVRSDLVHFFLQHSTYSPKAMRRAGLDTRNISNTFRFRCVRSREEYIDVLKLRLKAYRLAGKTKTNGTIEDMIAPLDDKSRILTAYHHNKLVASVSLTFPDREDLVLDTERALPNGYPSTFPSKLKMIEISRLCTDPYYRDGDLLVRMFEHIYRITLSSNREYHFTSTDSKLWPLYKRMGFRKTGLSYAHPFLEGLEHHIIYIQKDSGISGKNVSVLAWNHLYRNMNDYLSDRGHIKRSLVKRAAVVLYTAVGRLLRVGKREKY